MLRYIELCAIGDFDMEYTDSVWYGANTLEMPDLYKFVKESDLKGARTYLRGLGYTMITLYSLRVGSEL